MAMDIGNTTKFIATDEVVLKSATHTQGVEFTAVEIDVRTTSSVAINLVVFPMSIAMILPLFYFFIYFN